MGYYLSSIFSISSEDRHKYFVFYIASHGIEDTVSRWINVNFAGIAQHLGPHAVIVRGLTEDFDEQTLRLYGEEIRTFYLGRKWENNFDVRAFDRWIANEALNDSGFSWSDLVPALIVTDKNPQHKEPGQIFYIIPLGRIRHEEEVRDILMRIFNSIRIDDFEPLEDELQKRFGRNGASKLKLLSSVFELKPNIAGVGININALIDMISGKLR